MPSRYRFARLALVALALSLLTTAGWAQNKVYDFELGGFYTFVRFDGETSLEYKLAPSLMFGWNFTKKHELEVMGTMGASTSLRGDPVRTDFGILRLGYAYNFYPKERITSAFRAGVARWAIDPERVVGAPSALDGNDQHFVIYFGGGVRFHFKDWFALRLSGTLDIVNTTGGIGKSDTEATGDIGFVFFLGEKAPEPEKPAEEPEGEKPPAEKPQDGETKPPRV